MKTNPGSEAVRQWDAIWRNYIAALRMGRPEFIAAAKRAIADFDRQHGLKPLRLGK